MMVLLNGEMTDTRGAANVAELAEKFDLPANAMLVEHNGTALFHREWGARPLVEGDRIEFVRVVAGG